MFRKYTPHKSFNNHGYSGRRGGGFQHRPRGQSKSLDSSVFVKRASDNVVQPLVQNTHTSFTDFNLTNPVKDNIAAHGYTLPTPVQDQAIAPILDGRDLIGLANTGTGKTAAFLIPIIDKIFRLREQRALIIAPTRKLAFQINEEFRSFAKDLKVYSAVAIGGANMGRQIYDIRRNPHVVIGTPGRLKDLIGQNVLHLDDYSIFVLDELDLMLSIVFIQILKYFISL